jgi:uncharacterized protein (AIM24 family)
MVEIELDPQEIVIPGSFMMMDNKIQNDFRRSEQKSGIFGQL